MSVLARMPDLESALAAAREAPVLLVVCDFDGTLSPIAPRPDMARPDERAVGALSRLARQPHTHGAVISGRALADMMRRIAPLRVTMAGIRFVGSHGLEFEGGVAAQLPVGAAELLEALRADVARLVERCPGAVMEVKPASVTFHFRQCDPACAESAVAEIVQIPGRLKGVHLLSALAAVELCVVKPDKGLALDLVRRRVGATSVAYFGDDTTDEHAFATLGDKDIGVRVGQPEATTGARFRIDSQAEVADCLDFMLAARRKWWSTRAITPIEHHAVLSDQRTVALVDPRGGVNWLCLPRLDSAAVMGALVGGEQSGAFTIAPAGGGGAVAPSRRYVNGSMVLRTEWGGLSVTDYLDCSGGRAFQRAGRTDLVRVVEGCGRVAVRFAPRLDFGRVPTHLTLRDGGLEVEGWPDPMTLVVSGAAVDWRIEQEGSHQYAAAELSIDGTVVFEMRYGTASVRPSMTTEAVRRDQTSRFWSGWASSLNLPPIHAECVKRSAIIIKAMCYGPTGSIAAAGTTSLPEHLGGVRNWDYRYCWPRDAAMGAAALIRLGNTGAAIRLLDWLAGVVEKLESPERLRPLYSVLGAELGPEAEVGELPGYGESRPVRIGNAAALQVQLDVFGPIVDLAAMLAEAGVPLTPEYWKLVRAMVQAVEMRWREPDHGIWELRRSKRQHVHSKVMCWHAVNRALVVADLGMGRHSKEWELLRDSIAADVLANGWNGDVGAFTTAYGEVDLDAASLAIGLSGLIPATDVRWVSTVEAVQRGLCRNGLVYRYLFDDGLAGVEGGWVICTGWLIEALASIGRVKEARAMLDQLVKLAGDLCLMPEQYDPETMLGLGNYPQVYSHLAVINAALCLSKLEKA